MSASDLQIVTFEYPRNVNTPSDFQRVPGNLSFSYQQDKNLRTLSTHLATKGTDLTGFLYVPTLAEGSSCINASAEYVSSNVTRQSDLSSRNSLIAIAPWISPACTFAYLDAAPGDLTDAFVFFLPDQGTQDPPSADDTAWTLGDNGRWKTSYDFPVYAVPTSVGAMILDEMTLYSGNVSSVPYGQELIDDHGYPADAYVRLYMDISTGSRGGLPSIWVFLLVILAVLLIIIGLLSLALHLIQRRRRNALRTRIATGEVDIESLGVRKLTVPQAMIDKLPSYLYVSTPDAACEKSHHKASASPVPPPLHQPTCAICLDDFVPSDSRVRELPCRHIFHPECVDLFLHDNSSLCPLCKKSVLPIGYCPARVTNAMVRRERQLTRLRARNANQAGGTQNTPSIGNRLASMFGRRSQPSNEVTAPSTSPVEMTSVAPTGAAASSPLGRREWARRRALAMLGPRSTPENDEQEQPTSRPRKLLRNIFPRT